MWELCLDRVYSYMMFLPLEISITARRAYHEIIFFGGTSSDIMVGLSRTIQSSKDLGVLPGSTVIGWKYVSTSLTVNSSNESSTLDMLSPDGLLANKKLTETPSVTTRLANAREPFSPFKSSRLNIKLEREFAFRSWNIGRVLTI